MLVDATTPTVSKTRLWAGRIASGLVVAFLLLDGIGKLIQPDAVIEGTVRLGYPASVILELGLVLLASTILYAIPRTAFLGAILLTGYLGGAVATHVRIGDPLFTHVLFPVYLGVLAWGALFLRDARIARLLSFQSRTETV